MKRKTFVILIILLVVAFGAYFGFTRIRSLISKMESGLQELAELKISNVDLSKVPGGTYSGRCEAGPVAAEVRVTVADHKIAGIDLIKHSHGKGSAAEVIPSQVVDAQSLEIDVVSGATFSSKVILKAIENALRGAK